MASYLETVKLVSERYPQAANWLAQHPDLLNIYVQSVAESWPPERLQAALSNTAYYKATSDKQRQWDVLKASNPGEAAIVAQRNAVKAADYASRLGLTYTGAVIQQFGTLFSSWGSTDEEIHDFFVGQKWKGGAGVQQDPGEFGATITKVKKVADEYAVPISDEAAAGWAHDLLTSQSRGGRRNEDSLRETLRTQAASLFPHLREELEAGRTVADWAQPYKAIAAQELGVAADTITFNDPKWQAMLKGVEWKDSNAMGVNFRPMTLAEWQSRLRTDAQYGYDKTNNGRQAAAGLAQELGKMFGSVG